MKRVLLFGAATVMLVANGLALMSAWQNRREALGGTMELTERELPLVRISGDRTVTVLDLQWDCARSGRPYDRSPKWLDAAKLADAGFDCSMPLTDQDAAAHYQSQQPREVFLVLEFEGSVWREAPKDRDETTRLFVIDVDRDADVLRKRHADNPNGVTNASMILPP